MATGVATIEFDAGRANVSALMTAAAAVGTYLPLNKSGIAIATDDSRVYVKNGGVITDFVGGCATGTVQAEINGDPLSAMVDVASQQASNAGRKRLALRVPGNSWLRFKVIVVLA